MNRQRSMFKDGTKLLLMLQALFVHLHARQLCLFNDPSDDDGALECDWRSNRCDTSIRCNLPLDARTISCFNCENFLHEHCENENETAVFDTCEKLVVTHDITKPSVALTRLQLPDGVKEGCVLCFIDKRSSREILQYYFNDGCPEPRDEVSHCAFPVDGSCEASNPSDVRFSYNLTDKGLLDVTMSWVKPIGVFWGYELHMGEKCIRVKTSFVRNEGGASFQRQEMTLTRLFSFEFGAEYKLRMSALPNSRDELVGMRVPTAPEICRQLKERGYEHPQCYFVMNVMIDIAQCQKGIAVVKWDNPVMSGSNRYQSSIVYRLPESNKIVSEILPHGISSFTFRNITSGLRYYFKIALRNEAGVQLLFGEQDSFKCVAKSKPSTGASISTSLVTRILVPLIAVIVLVIAALFYCAVRQVSRNINTKFEKLLSRESHNENENGDSANAAESIYIVYPHGCIVIEKLVVLLAKQLGDIGITVFADCLYATRIDEVGLPMFMVECMEKADKVVLICSESASSTTLSIHLPYRFVVNNLIAPSFVFNDSRKFVAAYFSAGDLKLKVPAYLLDRAFQLPSEYDSFLLWCLGIPNLNSGFYKILIRAKVGDYHGQKKDLGKLLQVLNSGRHSHCVQLACSKGQVQEPCAEEGLSMEDLEEAFSLNRHFASQNSLHFDGESVCEENREEIGFSGTRQQEIDFLNERVPLSSLQDNHIGEF